MNFLIDGSNAVHALFGPLGGDKSKWDEEAKHFVTAVERWASGQPKLQVEIVFDGGFRNLGSTRAARLVFSNYETADSLILERINALDYGNKSVTVVTWDKVLADAVKAEGAKVLGPDQFWSRIHGRFH